MRSKLKDRILPSYSRGEEIFNMVSHIVGASLGVVALFACIILTAWRHNIIGMISSGVYGLSMITLYTMSSIYHGLKSERAKKIFQVLDHCAIYLLIAGSYTPIALNALRRVDSSLGWVVFGLQWALAIVAITLTAIDLKKYQLFSMVFYLLMGWGVLLISPATIRALTLPGFVLLLAGGVAYTIGAILYGIGKKKRYMHNVFHVFVLIGSFFHFFTILLFAL
jgi:hemolysin III